jgi:hypothetical protein
VKGWGCERMGHPDLWLDFRRELGWRHSFLHPSGVEDLWHE